MSSVDGLTKSELRNGIDAMLRGVCSSHPKGHTKKMMRYQINRHPKSNGAIVLELGEDSPVHLWVRALDMVGKTAKGVEVREYPASKLNERGPDGTLRYGRHSNLRAMSEMGEADLLRFTPKSLDEAWRVIDAAVMG